MGHYASDFDYTGPSQPKGYSSGNTVTKTCNRCWAQVGSSDVEKHDEWHAQLAATAVRAYYADAMTRPIG